MTTLKTEMPSQSLPQDPTRSLAKVFEMLGILALFLMGVVWFGGAYANQDPVWFSSEFTAQPSVICFYYHGQTRELRPADPAYAAWVARLNREMVRYDGYLESIHPSGPITDLATTGCVQPAEVAPDQSLTYYQLKGVAIELQYATEVQVHTAHFFPEARRLLLAIDGPYSYIQPYILFRGGSERYLPNGLVIQKPTETLAALDTLFAAPQEKHGVNK